MPTFVWTEKKERAALLAAEDRLTNEQIARAVGVTRRALDYWRVDPAFFGRVESIVAATRAGLLARGIAERQNRVDALNERWTLLRQVIAERSRDPETAKFAGGSTGLLVRTPVLVKAYNSVPQPRDGEMGDDEIFPTKSTILIETASLDTGLLAELRAHEKQSAQELGQWTERRELTGKDGGPIEIASPRDDLARKLAQLAARTGPRPPAGGPESG